MGVPNSSCCFGIGADSETLIVSVVGLCIRCVKTKTRLTLKIIENSNWMLEIMKFGTQGN